MTLVLHPTGPTWEVASAHDTLAAPTPERCPTARPDAAAFPSTRPPRP